MSENRKCITRLPFLPRFADAIRRGTKCQTIRKRDGSFRWPVIGSAIHCVVLGDGGERTIACGICESVTLVEILDINDEEARADGFADADELRQWFFVMYDDPDEHEFYRIKWRPGAVPQGVE